MLMVVEVLKLEVAMVEFEIYIVLGQPVLCMFVPLVELLGLGEQAMSTVIGVGTFSIDRHEVGEWFLGIDIMIFRDYATVHNVHTIEMKVFT